MKLNQFDIAFDSLGIGEHHFQFEIGKEVFEFFDHDDFLEVGVNGSLTLIKSSSHINMSFTANGIIEVDCDRCGEKLELPVKCEQEILVKFSSRDIDSNSDEIIYLGTNESQINVARFYYEMMILWLPLKKIHEESECNPDVVDFLNQWSEKEEEETDPRWDALKKLK
ncbi:MAG: uncharacterized metal-binding protein YceD (DUF177 family) [Patiriisocius sp.]|jgi:uncharacterized metal-binding protein YceD (DUF177 family)